MVEGAYRIDTFRCYRARYRLLVYHQGFQPFAWVVIISGAFMGFSFAVQFATSIYQMWFYRLPQDEEETEQHTISEVQLATAQERA